MTIYYRQNFGKATLGANLSAGATQLTLQSGHNFPTDSESKVFRVVIWNELSYPNPADDPNVEIMELYHKDGDDANTFQVSKGKEGTSDVAHSSGESLAMNYTAEISNSDLFVIGSVIVDETNKADGKILAYNLATGKLEYVSSGGSILPPQTGNNGKFLKTDGSNATWDFPLPDQTGNNGKYLRTNGSSAYWDTIVTTKTILAVKATSLSSFPNDSYTKIQYNSVDIDTLSEWDSSNYKWVASNDGKYLISASFAMNYGGTFPDQGQIAVKIYKNGSSVAAGYDRQSGTGRISVNCTKIVNCSKNDYIEIYGYQNSGSSKTPWYQYGEYIWLNITRVD